MIVMKPLKLSLVCFAAIRRTSKASAIKHPSPRKGKRTIRRIRAKVADIYHQLGPTYFTCAFRMKIESFNNLARILNDDIARLSQRCRCSKYYIVSGPIHPSLRLAIGLRYFAGAQLYNLVTSFCVSHSEAAKSVWYMVDAINQNQHFKIEFPTSEEEQMKIAREFYDVSGAGFVCCAGAIDGILIWILKPTEKDCIKAGCSSGKFFCGRKHKFGLNCQAICKV